MCVKNPIFWTCLGLYVLNWTSNGASALWFIEGFYGTQVAMLICQDVFMLKSFIEPLNMLQQGEDITDKRLLVDRRSLLWGLGPRLDSRTIFTDMKRFHHTTQSKNQNRQARKKIYIWQPGMAWKMWEVKMVRPALMSVFHNHNTVDVTSEVDIRKI